MKKFAALFLVFTLSLSTVAFASPSMTDNHDGTFTYDRTGVVVNSSNEKVGQVDPSAGMSAELTMLSNVSASTVKAGDFTDVPSTHWAKAAIDAMAAKGVIKGVGNNKFDPEAQVSRAQFVAMMVRAFGEDEKAIAQEQGNLAEIMAWIGTDNPEDFTANVMCAGQKFGFDDTWVSVTEWKRNADRADMAHIIMTVTEAMGTEKFTITEGIERNIGDYGMVSNSSYKDDILKAYSAGILNGSNTGNYEPANDSTRAQAATVMQRVLDTSKRTPVTVKPETPVTPPTQPDDNSGNTGAFGDVYPKEGDVINGTKVTRDPVTGVLGYGNGQKGGIYLGLVVHNDEGKTSTIQAGSYAPESYDNMNSGDKYVERHGYTFWSTEWGMIRRVAEAKLPEASAANVGQKADISGNIIKSGSNTPAFWVCEELLGNYTWQEA